MDPRPPERRFRPSREAVAAFVGGLALGSAITAAIVLLAYSHDAAPIIAGPSVEIVLGPSDDPQPSGPSDGSADNAITPDSGD